MKQLLVGQGEPPTPQGGRLVLYSLSSDGLLYFKDSRGNKYRVLQSPNTFPLFTASAQERYGFAATGQSNFLQAWPVELAQPALMVSISTWVQAGRGNIRLGIYDNTGPGLSPHIPGPGTLLGQTADTAVTQSQTWHTAPLTSTLYLQPGSYWLAINCSSDTLAFRGLNTGQGRIRLYVSSTYASLPAMFLTGLSTNDFVMGIWATMQVQEDPADA